MNHAIFGYYIDLDERGDFRADVRDREGATVFEIADGDSLGEDESSIFEDGFMRNKSDIAGLEEHLKSLGIIPADGQLMTVPAFEVELEARQEAGEESPTPSL